MIRAFIMGCREFRQSVTSSFEGHQMVAYELGRELAHRLTCRKFEPCP